MNIIQKCEYCGNTSGKVDFWGGCISCGAQFKVIETNRFGDEEYLPAPYNGVTGSFQRNHLSSKEIRDIVRRSVGL